jgi:phage FluMu gp28-like protein
MAMTTNEAVLITPPPLHPGQRQALSSSARFIVLIAGRRWGKSKGGSVWLLDGAMGLGAGGGTVCQWVAPTYGVCKFGWRELVRLGDQIPGARIWSRDRATGASRVVLPNGAEIVLGSSDHPDSLRGEGLTRVVVDEAAMVPPSAWTDALYPALGDHHGRALLISTPKGPNWLQKRFVRGQDPKDDEYQSFRFPSSSNPFLNPAVIEKARQELPDVVFRQEYLAEFIADGAVFRNVEPCCRVVEPMGDIVVGVDWAQSDDFSVFTAVDIDTGAVIDIDRLNQVSYPLQIDRLKQFCERYSAVMVLAEDNGPGAAPCDYAAEAGLPLQRFTTTPKSKPEIISSLIAAFDHEEIALCVKDPWLQEVLVSELQAYTMTRLPSSGFKFSAPEGMHDDCVMSLAIAWEARKRGGFVWEAY